MRRVCLWVALALALLLGLLSACEPEAAENNSRPEQGELALPLEGDAQERLDVVLWQEEGFSLYVPARGWYQEKDGTWRPETACARAPATSAAWALPSTGPWTP